MRSPGRLTAALARVRPRWRVLVATTTLALATAACAVGPGARLLDEQVAGASGSTALPSSAAREVSPPGSTVPPAPAAIDEAVEPAAVAPGACGVAVYTPPTASIEHHGELCRPVTAGAGDPETVVILVHGGGGYSGSPDATEVWRDEHLAAGRSTFTITYTLLDPTAPATTFPRPEQNVKAAVQWVRAGAGLTDPTIVVHGFSAGARLGAIVATTAADPTYGGDELWPGVDDDIDGALLFYGYYDGMQFFEADYYGSVAPGTASSIAAADAGDPALLIVHGTDDVLAPTADSVALAEALTTAGGSGELVLVDGADHAFDGYGTAGLTPDGQALRPLITAYLDGLGDVPG